MPLGDRSFGLLFLLLFLFLRRLGGTTGSAAWLLIVAIFLFILIFILVIRLVWVLLRSGKSSNVISNH